MAEERKTSRRAVYRVNRGGRQYKLARKQYRSAEVPTRKDEYDSDVHGPHRKAFCPEPQDAFPSDGIGPTSGMASKSLN
jgi:hypothetical protein